MTAFDSGKSVVAIETLELVQFFQFETNQKGNVFQNCYVEGVVADLHCCYHLWASFKMQCNQKVPRYNIFIFKAKHESTALRQDVICI